MKKHEAVINESETYRHPFKALLTGYGFFGGWNYAHFPASDVPELSLRGDKPFTLFTSVCFKNVQGGAILEQENSFCLGVMDGELYVVAVDWCAVRFSEYTVGKFTTDHWYELAIVYDGKILSAWLEGEKKDSFKCKVQCVIKKETVSLNSVPFLCKDIRNTDSYSISLLHVELSK